jgi:Uma2 family endonuclease
MATPPISTKRWTRLEYERLVDLGAFQPGERLELVGGDLLVREPQRGPHATGLGLVEDALRAAFGAGWVVRLQMPIALDEESEPEPDVAVVPGTRRDYSLGHPSRPGLLVEVADSTLTLDRERKGSLYARAGVRDYWIVNLVDSVLEVYREPAPASETPFGWRYSDVQTLRPGQSVSSLAAPNARISVSDLLP